MTGTSATLQHPAYLQGLLCGLAVLYSAVLCCQARALLATLLSLRLQLNALKRFLKLQAMPSLQEAYALPNSPKHIATITNSMQKVQLTQPPSPQPSGQAWPQFVPQHSRLVQNAPSQNLVMQSSAQQSHWALPRMHHKQQSSSNVDEALLQQRPLDTANAATASSQSSDSSTMAQPSLGHQREHSSANAASVRRQSNNNNLMKQSAAQQRHYASASAALQPGSTAAHKARPDWSNVTAPGSTKWLWERHDDMQPELQHFKEEELAEEAALQEQACKRHLAGYAHLLSSFSSRSILPLENF